MGDAAWKVLAWVERIYAIHVLVGGGGVLVTADTLQAYGWEPWQAVLGGFVLLFFLSWFIQKVFPGTLVVQSYGGQGPRETWKKTYWFHRKLRVVSDRCVKADDIFKKGSLAARGQPQTYENCLVLGPATLRATLSDEEPVRVPYSKGIWLPNPEICIQPIDESRSTPFTALRRVFFQNCEFRDVVFELKPEVLDEVNKKRKSGAYITP
jgi:hypothetical protein